MKLKINLIIIIVLILTIVIGCKLLNIPKLILTQVYPKKYSEYVYKYSKEFNVDPTYIFSIIKEESNFEEKAVSTSDAKGLMQLLESTAEELADNLNIEYIENETIYKPEINIMLGTKYFSNLLTMYNGNALLAFAAYNAGIGNVQKWIDNEIINKNGTDIENIPFKETNNYVRKILRNYKIYSNIY